MKTTKDGVTVEIERSDNKFYLTLKAVGKLTHEEYETIIPMIDSALEGVKEPKIRALFIGTEFDGWELRAAWDDFKLGLKHGKEFERIAIYGNKKWQEVAAKMAALFIPGESKFFDNYDEALTWIKEWI